LPFEDPTILPRVAIIGAGISGLTAAYELSRTHNVTLFEAAPRLGGHARTVMAGRNRDVAVDTGFIVFNHPNYPGLTRLFAELNVPTKPSDMSFSASIGRGSIEYGLKDLSALTAQTRNMVRPQFWRMISDILKFNKLALATSEGRDMSLGDFLDLLDLGEWFRRYYLLPMSGAIWSSTPEQMQDFPARSLVEFFRNHALLSPKNHQWHTVDGGSIQYVTRIAEKISANGGQIRTGAPILGVRRSRNGVALRSHRADWEEFDDVIFACHSDQALRLLEQPTPDERRVLGAMRFQTNHAVLHSDASVMPKRKRAWASWVFVSPEDQPRPRIGLTYWMNRLQGIAKDEPMFLSLNSPLPIKPDCIYDTVAFRHPVFDRAAVAVRRELLALQGQNRTYYCGAYTGWGFHEDGYVSAMSAAAKIRANSREVAA